MKFLSEHFVQRKSRRAPINNCLLKTRNKCITYLKNKYMHIVWLILKRKNCFSVYCPFSHYIPDKIVKIDKKTSSVYPKISAYFILLNFPTPTYLPRLLRKPDCFGAKNSCNCLVLHGLSALNTSSRQRGDLPNNLFVYFEKFSNRSME